MKKSLVAMLAFGLSACCLMGGTGCFGRVEEKTSKDPLTINVKVYKAGFGDDFIYELKQKFEAAYADEGYKMNVLPPEYGNAGDPMIREMYRGYKSTQIDLYITSAITPQQVSKAGQYGEVCEDLEELVFNQTAINYDGTESTDKISERIMPDLVPFLRAEDGTMYATLWAQTSAGMVVNTTKLKKYGVTELPKTTNELFEVFDMIRYGANGLAGSVDIVNNEGKITTRGTKTYPVTYCLSTGYQNCAISTWLAQYDVKAYNEFLRMQELQDDGSWKDMENGAQVFENENLLEVLKVGYQFMDNKYAALGSATNKLDQSQGLIMQNKSGVNNAVFMLNGDWFLNEVKANYGKNLDDIAFINVPVISALGTKLFGANTKYNLGDDECDELLSYIIGLVDSNKTVAEIIADVQANKSIALDEADAQAVATARGVCYTRGIEHVGLITKGSTKKNIAALALRMMASDDYANTFLRTANGSSPYAASTATSKYKFVNDAAALASNIHYRGISARVVGLRYDVLQTDYILPGVTNLALKLTEKSATTSYLDAATKLYNDSITEANKLWAAYKKS